jgi:hypothetical protein
MAGILTVLQRFLTAPGLPAILPTYAYAASQRASHLVVAHFLTEWAWMLPP